MSTGIFIFLAKICNTDVRKPCGKKNAEIQYILGLEFNAYLKKWTRAMKSVNQEERGFIEGYAFLAQNFGTILKVILLKVSSSASVIIISPLTA